MKTTRRKKTEAKPVKKLTNAELQRMSAEFDREFVADTFGPPTPDAKARLRRAKRKPGRPRIGEGSKAISVTVEKTLLCKVDRIAKRDGTTRAKLIAWGLKAILKKDGPGAR
ncbi:MAG: hypothetical protein KJ749_09950 [Planctomycetes bacterium]|nr:hypothetical protein [Planctomycetota bacterium]